MQQQNDIKPDWNLDDDDLNRRQGNRDAMVDRRMDAVVAEAIQQDWSISKRIAVAKYVRKTLAPLMITEVALFMPSALEELVAHVAAGYDRRRRPSKWVAIMIGAPKRVAIMITPPKWVAFMIRPPKRVVIMITVLKWVAITVGLLWNTLMLFLLFVLDWSILDLIYVLEYAGIPLEYVGIPYDGYHGSAVGWTLVVGNLGIVIVFAYWFCRSYGPALKSWVWESPGVQIPEEDKIQPTETPGDRYDAG